MSQKKINLENLESQVLKLFDLYESDYVDNEMFKDWLSMYDLLLLCCFMQDLKEIVFEEINTQTKCLYVYDGNKYYIPYIKIKRKE